MQWWTAKMGQWRDSQTNKQTNMFGDSWTHLMMKLINYLKLSSKSYVSQLLIQKHTPFLSFHFFCGKFFPTNPPTKLSKHRLQAGSQPIPFWVKTPTLKATASCCNWATKADSNSCPTKKNPHQKLGANKTFWDKGVGMSFVLSFFLRLVEGSLFSFGFGEVVLIICFWWSCIFMVVEESCLATWQRKNAYPTPTNQQRHQVWYPCSFSRVYVWEVFFQHFTTIIFTKSKIHVIK